MLEPICLTAPSLALEDILAQPKLARPNNLSVVAGVECVKCGAPTCESIYRILLGIS